ncbi:sensor histidine kinase [Microbacterium hominis]|uniref:Integral membrane sensor signal transduction histidine kinase n=1 Tax=Microbacterium hominis TaxID=162426 RepID=A0A7D4Q0P6_9MICO|nr:ATP-binding protein [Microbacterium hominis]QKJ19352.1 integral membrane sensor signal transduction histidine kinase [Microbacterium hominis]
MGLLGAFAAQLLAEREALNDAANTADVLAEAVIQPSLSDDLLTGDRAAIDALDEIVRERVLGSDVVRVKIWSPQGTVLYADEPQLIGRTFALGDDQRIALAEPQTRAEVSDLTDVENEFETGGRLLEVYRPLWTPDGTELLFEMYSPYAPVELRSWELWRGFAGVMVSSLLLLVFLTVPIVWGLLRRLRAYDTQHTHLLERAVDSSDAERRRIAGTLHDGPVQELVASSFSAETAAAEADAAGQPALGARFRQVAESIRGNVRVLRTLLIEIHPPGLTQAGLPAALSDLCDGFRGRGVTVDLTIDPGIGELSIDGERLVHRIAQECLRNAAAHAAPCRVTVHLSRTAEATTLDIADDGPGFDPEALARPADGHLGTRVIRDLAEEAGAQLSLRTAPGEGVAWRLVIPAGVEAAT